MPNKKPEVLAPAGSPEALRAAIGAGADAVYFGLQDWNARVRARNFELGDLPDILRDLRRWGVKSYLTFNTLVFQDEIAGARDALEAIAQAGPDGIIVQDLGVLRMARLIAPSLKVHASTQMTVASPDGVRLVASLGAKRVILARELTIPEIARIRAAVDTELEVFVHGAICVSYSGQCLSSEAWGGRSANRGQCAQACRLPYDLEVDGKRRNLGDRAYLLSPRDLEGWRRIPELTALGLAAFKIEGRMKSPEYVAAVTALYREAVDRAWENFRRQPGDDGVAPRPSLGRLAAESRQVFSRGASEGFLGGVNHLLLADGTTRAHRGPRVGTVISLEIDAKGSPRGVVMEEAAPESGAARVTLKPGDGVLFAVTPLEDDEVGGRLLSADPVGRAGHRVLEFPRVSMPDLVRVKAGTPVYRTSDPALMERLRRDLDHPERKRQVSLHAEVAGAEGEPLTLRLTDPEGRTVEVESLVPLEPARARALDEAGLREQMERFGGTRYRIAYLDVRVGEHAFLPVSELNRMRREAAEMMEELRGASSVGAAEGLEADARASEAVSAKADVDPGAGVDANADADGYAAAKASAAVPPTAQGADGEPEILPSPVTWALERAGQADAAAGPDEWAGAEPIVAAVHPITVTIPSPDPGAAATPDSPLSFEDAVVVLCRTPGQVSGALDAGARRIAIDFLDLVGMKEAARDLAVAGVRRTLALPRVQKPGEERIESFFLDLGPEEILVRSLGSIERLRRMRAARTAGSAAESAIGAFPLLVGDVSLNAVNPDAVEILLGLGLDRVTPGMDLNGEQLESLVKNIALGRGAAHCEISIHHHLPLFHTEHCVFAAFLGQGADFRTCGRPCDLHGIALRDRAGHSHPVVADVGCRNTVFGARPLSALAHLSALRRSGVRNFRVEMISQDRAGATRLVELHRAAWEGRTGVTDVQAMLQADSAYGLTIRAPEPPRAVVSRPAGSRAKPAGAGMQKTRPRARRLDQQRLANRSHAGEALREPRPARDRQERSARPGSRPARPDSRPPRSDTRPARPSRADSQHTRSGSRPARPDSRSAQPDARPPRPLRPDSPHSRPGRPDARPPRPLRPDSQRSRPGRPDARPPRPLRPDSPHSRPDQPDSRPHRPSGPEAHHPRPDPRAARPDPRPTRPDTRPPRPSRPDSQHPQPSSRPARPDARPPRPGARPSRPTRPDSRPPRSDTRAPRPPRSTAGPHRAASPSSRGDGPARVRPGGPPRRTGKPGRPGPRSRGK